MFLSLYREHVVMSPASVTCFNCSAGFKTLSEALRCLAGLWQGVIGAGQEFYFLDV